MNYRIVSSLSLLTRRTIYTFSKSIKLVIQIPSISSIAKNKHLNRPKIHKLIIKQPLRKKKSQLRDQKNLMNRNFVQKNTLKIKKQKTLSSTKKPVNKKKIKKNKKLRNSKMRTFKSNRKKVHSLN